MQRAKCRTETTNRVYLGGLGEVQAQPGAHIVEPHQDDKSPLQQDLLLPFQLMKSMQNT